MSFREWKYNFQHLQAGNSCISFMLMRDLFSLRQKLGRKWEGAKGYEAIHVELLSTYNNQPCP
jgi:hypothetical protein